MSQKLRRPWVAALVVTVVFAGLVVALTTIGDVNDAAPGQVELPTLSPNAGEIALAFASPVVFFLLLWLLFSLVARRRSHRDD